MRHEKGRFVTSRVAIWRLAWLVISGDLELVLGQPGFSLHKIRINNLFSLHPTQYLQNTARAKTVARGQHYINVKRGSTKYGLKVRRYLS